MRRLSRRDLLRDMGIGAAAVLAAACQPKVVEVTRVVEKEVEKVVKETVIVEGTPQVVEKVVEKAVTAAPVTEPVTLVVETYQWEEGGFREWMDWINAKLVSEQPNVKIEKRSAPYTEYWDKLLVKMQAGTMGDVFQGQWQNIEQWLAIGGLEAMNNYVDIDEVKALIEPALWSRIAVKDQLMGVPTMFTTSCAMIYNTKHFEAAGVTMPGTGEQDAWLDMTVKELTQAPERYGVVVHTIATNQLNEDLNKFVAAWNAAYSLEDGTPTCGTPEMVGAIEFYRRIVESGATPIGTEKTVYRPMVWNGKISQIIDGSWVFGMAMAEKGEAISELSASPLPFPTPRALLSFNLYQLYGKSKVKDLGAKWLSIAFSEEGAVEFSKLTGNPHARKMELPQSLVDQMPWLPAYATIMGTDLEADLNPGFTLVRAEADDIIRLWADRAILTREITPEEAAAGMQRDLEELSKRHGGKTMATE